MTKNQDLLRQKQQTIVFLSHAALWQDSKHVVDDGHWLYEHMFTLGLIIGGGTSQIQKNIIAERALGLPK